MPYQVHTRSRLYYDSGVSGVGKGKHTQFALASREALFVGTHVDKVRRTVALEEAGLMALAHGLSIAVVQTVVMARIGACNKGHDLQ